MQLSEESSTTESDHHDASINLDALHFEMDLRGWSTTELARRAGVHPTTLYKMEAAAGHCGRRTKAKLARALIDNPRPPAEILAVLGVRE